MNSINHNMVLGVLEQRALYFGPKEIWQTDGKGNTEGWVDETGTVMKNSRLPDNNCRNAKSRNFRSQGSTRM